MFLSRLAERSGLFGILAPRKSRESKDARKESSNDTAESSGNVDKDTVDKGQEESLPENNVRKRRLDYQRKMEAEAESRGAFAKKQRVRYHNKLQDRWDDAIVVGVHHDDGPDKPYYVSCLYGNIDSTYLARTTATSISCLSPFLLLLPPLAASAPKDYQI